MLGIKLGTKLTQHQTTETFFFFFFFKMVDVARYNYENCVCDPCISNGGKKLNKFKVLPKC